MMLAPEAPPPSQEEPPNFEYLQASETPLRDTSLRDTSLRNTSDTLPRHFRHISETPARHLS